MAARLSGRPTPKKKGKDPKDEAEETGSSNQDPKKRKFPLLWLIIAAIVIALLAFILINFLGPKEGTETHSGKNGQSPGKEEPIDHGPIVQLGDFTVNLVSDPDKERRYLRTNIAFSLKTTDKKYLEGSHEEKKSMV